MTGDKQNEATAEFNEALAAGFAAGNFDGVGPFYTEDAILMPPRGKILEGRAAASAFWLGVSNRFTGAVFSTVATKSLGETALRESGTYAMQSAEGPGTQGKYVFVWQLVEGEWQIESSIWNRNAEAGGGRAEGQERAQGQGQAQGRRQGMGGQGGNPGGGYRRAGAQGGYRGGGGPQGSGRPSFQGGGQGGLGGGGRRRGGAGGGQGGGPGGGYGGGSLYEGNPGLYSTPKD